MSTQLVRGKTTKILVLNPNSSQSMTASMRTVINSIDLPNYTEIYTYTAPSDSPASINDGDDIEKSTKAVMSNITNASDYDGILVACFSVHSLVPALHISCETTTGIFEASILTALSLIGPGHKWGIVTTGKFWEKHLAHGVDEFLGAKSSNNKFAGVESTGLNASDFHDGVDKTIVEQKLKEATKRLLSKGRVSCIVLGCAGMTGLEDIVRSAAAEEHGDVFGQKVLHVVDGVRAGVMQVETMVKYKRLRGHS